MNWLADKIEHWPVDRLIPYARNARTHSDAQVAQIAASIAEFGFTNPILAGSDGVIVAGHGRLAAAQKLGLARVPVVVLDHLTLTQRRALVLADNRIAEQAGWDAELLKIELDELEAADFDLGRFGFDDGFLADFLGEEEPVHEGRTDEDAIPEAGEQTLTQPGDVWVLGPHRLVCGDATRAESYERLFASGEKARLLWTDPPYNVAYAADDHQPTIARRPIANDALGADFEPFLRDALSLALAHTEGACYIAMSSSELHTLRKVFEELGGHWSTYIIWAKDVFTLGRADYQRQYEPILYGWPKGANRHWCGDRDQGDVWQIKKPQRNDLHPTMKPVELVERAIRNSSRPGDVVLDPFGGSGTTLIAAEKSGRQARLIELDPKYVDTIVRRWQDFTGQQATREAGGVAFDQAASDSSMISQ